MRHIHLVTAAVLLLVSCATETPRVGPLGHFSVKVVPYFGKDVRVYIAAYSRNADGTRGPDVTSHRVSGDGITGFVVPAGQVYGVRAYADLDGDGRPGAGDPTASLEGLKPQTDLAADDTPAILTLPGTGEAADWPGKKSASSRQIGPFTADDVRKAVDEVRSAAPELPIPPVPASKPQ